MENLYRRLGSDQPSEEIRVKMIRRNLLPEIQAHLALQSISSISELIAMSRRVEENLGRMQRFCPPPTNYRQLLEPELAYRKPIGTPTICSTRVTSREGTSYQPELPKEPEENLPSTASIQPKNNFKCFNCNELGHKFRQCEQKLKKFCFKCGRANVMTPNCPSCQKNGQRDQS